MRKKTSLTIVERAIIAIPGFEEVFKKIKQQVELRGQSQSTLNNYIRRIALISLHFGRLPEQIEEDEINEYLVALARDPKSPSRMQLLLPKTIGIKLLKNLLHLPALNSYAGFAGITCPDRHVSGFCQCAL